MNKSESINHQLRAECNGDISRDIVDEDRQSAEMAGATGDTIIDAAGRNRDGLVDALQPILRWLRALGTDLDVGQRRSKLERCSFILSAILMLVLVDSANLLKFYLSPVEKGADSLATLCKTLGNITRVVSAILFQTTIVWMTLSGWKRLWRRALDVTQSVSFEADFASKLRRTLLTIFSLILAVVKTIESSLI